MVIRTGKGVEMHTESNIAGHAAIITGASSGIGMATAVALAQRGAKVVLAARRLDRLRGLAKRIKSEGGDALAVRCDVSNLKQVQNLSRKAVEAFGRIDILINNAGVMANAPMSKCRIEDWDDMIDINLRGLLYCTGTVLPILLKQKTGHIVNISSVAGRKVLNNGTVYAGTKHAVHAISEGLRSELAESSPQDGNRIRVTIVAPGVVITELPDSIRDKQTRDISKKYYSSLPGPLSAQDIANAILFALEAPHNVNLNEILVRPTSQVR